MRISKSILIPALAVALATGLACERKEEGGYGTRTSKGRTAISD